jgi:hypothetical protein
MQGKLVGGGLKAIEDTVREAELALACIHSTETNLY